MANKRKILEVNNHKLRKKRFKVTSTQPDYYSKNQESLNQRKSNSKSLPTTCHINCKNTSIQNSLKAITLLDSDAYQTYIKEISIPLISSQYYEEIKK